MPEDLNSQNQLPLLEVNGVSCIDSLDFHKRYRAALESGDQTVTLIFRGPETLPFLPFVGKSLDEMKDLAEQNIPGVKDILYSNPITPGILLAIAFLILAIGVAIGGTIVAGAIAIALVMGISQGYGLASVNIDTSGGASQLNQGIEIKLEKQDDDDN